MKKLLILILLVLSCNSISFAQTDQEIFENGVLFFKQGLYQEAIDQFSELIKQAPQNADAYKNRGVAYMKQEKFDQAIQDFEQAKSIFPQLKDLYSNLGVAWYYKKNCEKAIENYDIEIQMSPENSVAYFNRALCRVELNQPIPANKDLDKTLELKPDFYWAICFKADLLAADNDHAGAIKMYEKALKVNPDNPYPTEKMTELAKMAKLEKTAELKKSSQQKQNETPVIKQPAAKAKGSSEHVYALQAGVFKNQSNANKRNKLLLKNDFDSRILILKGKNDIDYYSVRIGSYTLKKDAIQAKADLMKTMKIESIIRKKGDW